MIDEATLSAAEPRDKPYRVYPGNGLYLIVLPNGAKWWRYNVRRNGINTTLSLGPFPAVSMAEALAERGILRTQARMGIDPAAARRAPFSNMWVTSKPGAIRVFALRPGLRRAAARGRARAPRPGSVAHGRARPETPTSG
ncbi:Arm DNA-binding domain-containing protein [Metallibacterium scheffleri]|uniref:Integrase DNA-binding domain-containing protein n=1 Tax=Metallibacterium scheffleri TaxID=993689 RepID=A0A4S3KN40_9GAMM|nr:hypothetical protein B1806_09010 [Metallibacterium scheffleri]